MRFKTNAYISAGILDVIKQFAKLGILAASIVGGITAGIAPAAAAIPFTQPQILQSAVNTGDTAWILAASLFALLLTVPGLALYYGGRVESRNFLSVIFQCGAIAAIVSVLWIIVGYTLAFGLPGSGIIGAGNAWMMIGLGEVREATLVPESAFAVFQMVSVIFAAAIMIGAWAERAHFGWVIAFCGLWSLIVYAPIAHWIWGGGWLAANGTIDYAGGIVIHLSAGVSALVAAIMIGRRTGWPQTLHVPNSPALSLAGAGLLWAGWLALVGGNELAAGDGAASSIMNTHLAASLSALVWSGIERFRSGSVTVSGFAKGALAGLVAISAGAGLVSPGGAILIGLIAAPLSYFAARLVKNIFAIDDALDVFAVHGIGGIAGALLTAIFVSESFGGLGFAEGVGSFGQLITQLIAVAVVVIWSVVGTLIIGLALSTVLPMRVSKEDEMEGLDKTSHGQSAWDID